VSGRQLFVVPAATPRDSGHGVAHADEKGLLLDNLEVAVDRASEHAGPASRMQPDRDLKRGTPPTGAISRADVGPTQARGMNADAAHDSRERTTDVRQDGVLRFHWVTRIFGSAAVFLLLVFGAYNLAEGLWWSGLGEPALGFCRRMRDVVAAVGVSLMLGRVVLTSSPTLLARAARGDGWPSVLRLTPEDQTRLYVQWFVAMRWIATLLAGLLAFLGVRVLGWLPAAVGWPLTLTVAVLAGVNVLYSVLPERHRSSTSLLLIQACLDLAILTTLLHFSGASRTRCPSPWYFT